MARIAGVDLPLNKRVQIGLTYIFGIGKSRATRICQEAGIDLNTKVKNLTEEEAVKIRNIIQRDGMVEGDLRKSVSMDIKRLMEIGCYRGLRHRRGFRSGGREPTRTRARERARGAWQARNRPAPAALQLRQDELHQGIESGVTNG